MKWAILFFVLAFPLRAQVLVPQVGASDLYGSQTEGGGATLYLPNGNTIYGSAGIVGGHFVGGLLYNFKYQDFIVHAGSQQFGVGFAGIGEGLSLVGVSVEKKRKNWSVDLFVGSLSNSFSTPFMLTASPQAQIGGGVFATYKFKNIKLASLESVENNKMTAAEGLDFTYHRTFQANVSGGILEGATLFQASAAYQPVPWINLNLNHSDYILPFKATSNSGGLGATVGRFTANVSLNEAVSNGVTTTGEGVSGSVKAGIVTEQVGVYKSQGALNRTLINSNTSEKISRFIFTETVSDSGGHKSFQLSGAYHNNRMSVAVNRSVTFLVDGEGFANTTSVSVSLMKLPHDTSLTFQTITTPFHQTLYSTSSNSYVPIGNGTMPGQTHRAVNGKFEIEGVCLDGDKKPLYGCAIEVGKGAIAFSDHSGKWSVREKSKTSQPLLVLPLVFAAPGNYRVVDAPHEVRPGETVTIVVSRD